MSPEELEPKEGISRRKMIKRIGAGAAVAWTAPVLTSLKTPAFAQYGGGCGEEDCGCSIPCNVAIPCGPGGSCNCWVSGSSSACRCLFFVQFCGDFGDCPTGQDSECPSTAPCCINTCCGFTCAPACGSSGAGAKHVRGAGRTTR